MPWTKSNYPISMKNLPARVRAKAIEIANALLRTRHDEGMAIPIAIARAREVVEKKGEEHDGSPNAPDRVPDETSKLPNPAKYPMGDEEDEIVVEDTTARHTPARGNVRRKMEHHSMIE